MSIRINVTSVFVDDQAKALAFYTDKLGFGSACRPSAVPLGATALKLHDAVDQGVVPLLSGFPYLNTPVPGSK